MHKSFFPFSDLKSSTIPHSTRKMKHGRKELNREDQQVTGAWLLAVPSVVFPQVLPGMLAHHTIMSRAAELQDARNTNIQLQSLLHCLLSTGTAVDKTGEGDPDKDDPDPGGVCSAEHLSGRQPRCAAAAAGCEGHVGIPLVCSHSMQEVSGGGAQCQGAMPG